MRKTKKKVLLLGSSGNIGLGFRENYLKHYKKSYDLVLGTHKTKVKDKSFHTVNYSLNSINSLKKAMKGVDVVINLAANPDPYAEFKDLVEPNLIGAYNVLEAARLAKVKRVIYASSVHTVKGYPEKHQLEESSAPKPINVYGATKSFGEALCSVFSNKYGLSCLAIRIGAYVSNDQKNIVCFSRSRYDYVITQDDMSQLIHRCIIAPARVKYAILAGISDNKVKRFDLIHTKRLIGYVPKDDYYETCRIVKKELRIKEKRKKK